MNYFVKRDQCQQIFWILTEFYDKDINIDSFVMYLEYSMKYILHWDKVFIIYSLS